MALVLSGINFPIVSRIGPEAFSQVFSTEERSGADKLLFTNSSEVALTNSGSKFNGKLKTSCCLHFSQNRGMELYGRLGKATVKGELAFDSGGTT